MKINIMLDEVKNDALTFLAFSFAEKCESKGIDPVFCLVNQSKINKVVDFSFFNCSDKFSESGIFIATSATTANILKSFCGKNNNIYYMWNLDWLEDKDFSYEKRRDKYVIPNFKYACRSEQHKKIVNKMWKIEKIKLIKDFGIKEIISLIEEEK